jgi:hypothetical protein
MAQITEVPGFDNLAYYGCFFNNEIGSKGNIFFEGVGIFPEFLLLPGSASVTQRCL